ncbi:hypothetical protein RhiirA4_409140, partial [Rhizophagus irregularis]
KEMMIVKAPIRSIIEVWFSTVWTIETLKHFENAVNIVLQYENAPNNKPPNPTKKEIHPKLTLLNHEIVFKPYDISLLESFHLWMINKRKIYSQALQCLIVMMEFPHIQQVNLCFK